MKRLLALIAVVLLLAMMFPYSASAASVDDIVAGWTPSMSGVGADTKAFDFSSMADAQAAAAKLQEIGYTETTEGLAETTVLAPNTYAFFDLASMGWGTTVTLYVYVPASGGATAPAAATGGSDVNAIVAGWTPSMSGVGADTMAFDFGSMADASAAASQLQAIGYTETTEGLAETTVLAPNTYAFFDLASMGWGTTVTLYVYVPGGGGASAPVQVLPAPAPAPAAGVPAELATAFDVGVWPLPAGSYDPALDNQGIPSGAHVYGLFDGLSYAQLPVPIAVTGFTEVTDISTLGATNYFVVLGSSGFNYVVLGAAGMSAGGSAPAPAAPAPAAPVVPIDGNVQEKVEAITSTWRTSASGVGADTFAFEFASMGDAQIAVADLVALGYSENADGLAEVTVQKPYTYSFFDLAAFGWGTTVTVYVYIGSAEPPKPLNVTFNIQDKTDLFITINDAFEKYGYFFIDAATSQQKEYLFRVKEGGSVSFSKDVKLGFVDISTGEILSYRDVKANEVVPITEIHDTRLYLAEGEHPNYIQFLNDKAPSFYIPPKYLNMADAVGSATNFKNMADAILSDGKLAPYSLFSGEGGDQLKIVAFGGFGIAIPMICIILFAQNREVKSGGVKFVDADFEEN